MGSFNVGDLSASIILDDSQYAAALERSKVGSTLFATEIARLRNEVISLASTLSVAGASIEELGAAFGMDSDAVKANLEVVAALQFKIKELNGLNGKTVDIEKALAAERVKNANQFAEGEARTLAIAKTVAAEREAIIKRLAANDVKYANQYAEAQARTLAITQATANERIALANQVAAGEARAADIIVALADQVALGKAQALAIEQELANARVALANQVAVGEARADTIALAAEKKAVDAKILLANQYADAEVRAAAIANAAKTETGLGNLGLRLTPTGVSPRGFIGAGSTGMLAAGAAGFAAFEIVKMTEASADAARVTENLATKLNLTWIQARELEQGARLAGAEIGGLAQSAFHLADALENSSTTGRKAAAALESMGVTGRSAGELFLDFVSKLSKITDETKRMDLLHEVFQRQSQAMVPYIAKLNEINAIMSILGPNINENLTKKLEAAAVSFSMLGIAWDKWKERQASGPLGTAATAAALGTTFLLTTDFNPFFFAVDHSKELKAEQDAIDAKKALAAKGIADAKVAAQAFRDLHHTNLEELKADLAANKTEIKELYAELGSVISPIPLGKERTSKETKLNADLAEELRLKKAIKDLSIDLDKLITKDVQGDARLSQAQTSLNRFADVYNSNVKILTDAQKSVVQTSFDSLNEVLNAGIEDGNISRFRAELANASEVLHRYISEDKQAIKDNRDALRAKTAANSDEAHLAEAQTALARFADAYNQVVYLLSNAQQGFIEGSFTRLNDILGKGAGAGNLSTFRAALGGYEEALHRFTVMGKQELAQANLGEAISKLWDKLNLAASENLSQDSVNILTPLLLQIQTKFDQGSAPELLKPFIDEFNNELSNLGATDSQLASQAKSFGVEYEKAFRLTTALTAANNKELETTMRYLTAVQQLQVTNPRMAAKLEDDFHQIQLRRILGIRDPNTLGQTQQSTMEFLGTGAELRDKQIALVKMFEAMSAISGETAEKISQDQKVMLDGVVQDYDALKDQISHKLSIVGEQWRELTNDLRDASTRFISGLGGALFDTLFPDFLKAKANPLQPLVDSFRSAFEQLSSYANPKAALGELIRSIQQAGTVSQANAIAVKYFGNTAGPLLAAELRDGTISAKDLAAAIDTASQSTTDYANKSTDQISQLTLLWRQLVKDVVTSIVEHLILVGLLSLLTWLGIIDKKTNTLGSAMDQVFTKLAAKLLVLFTTVSLKITTVVGTTVKAVEDIINGMYAEATVVIKIITQRTTIGQDPNLPQLDPSLFTPSFGVPGNGFDSGGFGGFGVSALSHSVSPRSHGSGVTVNAMTVVTNSPMDFVRQLKALRLVQNT